jgi:quinol monooxygenase YgiN
MIVVRFKVQCRPEKAEQMRALFAAVPGPSRKVEGVHHFDIGQSLDDPNTFLATEVFDDADAQARQESLPEVAAVMAALPDALAAPPEATIYEISGVIEPALS